MIDSKGDLTSADAMTPLDVLAGAGSAIVQKAVRWPAVQSSMTGEELLAVCFKIRGYHEQGPVGALAIVCTPEQTVEFARLLGALAAANRPIKMFSGLRQAHTWLGYHKS